MARKDATHDPTLGPAVTPVHIGGDSIVDRLAPHIKKIGVALLALVVVLVAFFSIRIYKQGKQEKSTARLVKALELGEAEVLPPEIDLSAIPGGKDKKTYPTQAARAADTLAALGGVGQARGAAALYEAGQYVQAGKLDEALAIYKRLSTSAGDDGVVAREGLGVVLEAQAAAAAADPAKNKQLLEEALAAFRTMQPDDKGLRRDFALYHEARVLDALDQDGEAIAQYKKALEVAPDTSLKPQIENRLAVLGATTK